MMKFCSKCGRLVPYPKRMCEECESKYTSNNSGRHDPRSQQFYNSKAWKDLSAYKLQQEHYTCEECGDIATDVHHIVPILDDWSKRLDYSNLQALCDSCHKKKRTKR